MAQGDAYYKSKRLSVSKLKCLANDPVEFKMRYVDDPPTFEFKPTDSMQFGQLVHCLFLEPNKFDAEYIVAPDVDRRTKDGKARWAEFLENSNGRVVIEQSVYDEARQAVDALFRHELINELMTSTTQDYIERPMEFELLGVPFQAKPDVVIPSMRIILDIKTVSSIRPNKFKYSACDLGYHIQAAAYRFAIFKERFEWYRFLFVTIETRTASTIGMPFKIAFYELDADAIQRGEAELESLVKDYQLRCSTGDWTIPYCNDIVSLSIPSTPFGYRKELEIE